MKSQVEVCKEKKKKCQLEYENEDESQEMPEDSFLIIVGLTILDFSLTSLNEYFELIDFYNINFKFLLIFFNMLILKK